LSQLNFDGLPVATVVWLEFIALAILGAALSIVLVSVVPRAGMRSVDPTVQLAAEAAERVLLPLWQLGPDGKVIWSNAAYTKIATPENGPGLPRAPERLSIETDDGIRWFATEVRSHIGCAVPIDDLVRAEANMRDMVQAMAKTFAHLPTGLAVFDHARHLHSFNPALADLTGLSPEFLSRRPSLIAMLDGMRDRNMIPEPKDWKGWRHQIADMERAAASGQFEDTWALPGGQTYRITGRRHPDGGLALMIDDISTEIIRSRRYRADLELCQRVVDTMDEAIAVFAVTGQLVMSNSAYAALWGHDPGERLAPMDFGQMAAHWRALSAPSALWAEAEDFTARLDDRAAWQAEARLLDGRLITCRFAPLSDGATLIGFSPVLAEIAPRALTATRAGA
jgi:PAS domain-containing protein